MTRAWIKPAGLTAATAIALPLLAAAFTNRVTITTEGDQRVVRSNGIPDHTPGRFPNKGNPNSIAALDYTFRMPLHPQIASEPTSSRRGFFGVALNGVPFEPGTAEFYHRNPDSGWNYEALSGRIDLGIDDNMAHVQPNGAYHYHSLPGSLAKKLGDNGKKMVLIGWAADGFPVYTSYGHTDPKDPKSPIKKMSPSWQLKKGQRPGGPDQPGKSYDGLFTEDYEYVPGSGDLDECNGRTGVTPEFPSGTYHYYITATFPYLPRYFKGTPDPSFKHGPPGGGRGPGGPPRKWRPQRPARLRPPGWSRWPRWKRSPRRRPPTS